MQATQLDVGWEWKQLEEVVDFTTDQVNLQQVTILTGKDSGLCERLEGKYFIEKYQHFREHIWWQQSSFFSRFTGNVWSPRSLFS